MKKQKSAAWYAAMKTKKHSNQYIKAKENNIEIPKMSEETRNKISQSSEGKKHTEETKNKIREKRIAYLKENPDKVPYKLNHYSKRKSYPEEYWKIVLETNDIMFEEEYQIGLYSLDYAFPNVKIDLEIDGEQHYKDKRIIESDMRRNEYLENLGWSIIRIRWSEFKKNPNKKEFIEKILNQIKTGKVNSEDR